MCGTQQEFASDFLAPKGTQIRAARGGYVADVYQTQTENCWEKPWCAGNHLIIEQQDGEYSFYTHMSFLTVYAQIGERIFRGQYVSVVGNTGNSSDPHLHFHVTDAAGGYGQTFRTRFELYLDAPSSDFTECRVPSGTDDTMASNNYKPAYFS